MARSYRKTPIIGNGGGSDAPGKRMGNRAHRRLTREAVKTGREAPHLRECSDPWSWPKDGKHWFGGMAAADVARYSRK